MSTGLLIFMITAGGVGFFVLAFSLTILFKGHYMRSEVGDNPMMQNRGIRCTAGEFRKEEAQFSNHPSHSTSDCRAGCSTCAAPSLPCPHQH